MKVIIGNFSLAAGGDESPVGLRINGRSQVQVREFLRAATVTISPRGNKTNTITFATTREHQTYAAAEQYLFTHAATLPQSGDVTFTTGEIDGSRTVFTATAAAVESDDGTVLGITTTHHYTLICGAVTGGSLGLKVDNPTYVGPGGRSPYKF